jgi:hypothetical protein
MKVMNLRSLDWEPHKMDRDYFQDALHTFNGTNWYGWKTHDDNGNKIPNDQRMQYKYIKIIKEGATMPTEAEVNAKVQELNARPYFHICRSNSYIVLQSERYC